MSPGDFGQSAGPLGLIAKTLLLIGAAGITVAALRRSSAAARHLVWLLALGGTIALAVIAPAAPSVRVRIPTDVVATWVTPSRDAHRPAQQGNVVAWDGTDPARALGGGSRARRQIREGASAVRSAAARIPAGRPLVSPATFLGLAWLLGVAVVIGRCIVAHGAVARVVASSARVSGSAWQQLIDDAAVRTRVRRPVAVMVSDHVGGPITSGVRHPVIVLPGEATSWTDERREIVLLHEMAHVARLDYVAQLVATAACALYWFNPAVWIAASRMRLEAEYAADDCVLSAGLTGVTYASHLVELARRAAIAEPAAVAVGIAHRRTHIERRVSAMLDLSRSRTAMSARVTGVSAAIMLVALVPFAGARTAIAATEPGEPALSKATTPTFPPVVVHGVANGVGGTPRMPVSTQRTDSTFERTLDAKPGERLSLDLDTGGEVVIHGWNEPRARIRVRLGGVNWRETRVDVDRVGDGLRIRSEFDVSLTNTSTRHEFELWIPRQTDVDLRSAGGGLTIEHLEGRISGHTGGGSIHIQDMKGRSSFSTGGGNIRVSDSDMSGSISTGGGMVVLSAVSGGLRGSSGSGPVVYAEGASGQRSYGARGARGGQQDRDVTADVGTMTITGDRITTRGRSGQTIGSSKTVTDGSTMTVGSTRGRLHISKAGGPITLDAAPDGGTIHTGGGDVTVGTTGGDVTVTTGGGDVEIRRVTGSATVSTGSGDVRITVVDENGEAHEIEASSGHGTIEVTLPRSLDARVELEAAYTEGFGRRSRVESEWSLEQSESRDWESPNGGTPRKFVRATGVLGNGRGLIRIKTVNGDVVLKRAR